MRIPVRAVLIHAVLVATVGCFLKPSPRVTGAFVFVEDKPGSGGGALLDNEARSTSAFSIEHADANGVARTVRWERVRSDSDGEAYVFSVTSPTPGAQGSPVVVPVVYKGGKLLVYKDAALKVWIREQGL